VIEGQQMAKEPRPAKNEGDEGAAGMEGPARERTRARRVESASEEESVEAPNEASALL